MNKLGKYLLRLRTHAENAIKNLLKKIEETISA